MVSVIIPVYNREKYIERCIKSALNQSYTDIEIIVVDDGSVDRTGAICDSMAEYDSRIKVLHQNNCGVTAARMAGIGISSGEWICFLDSDDTLPSDALDNYSKVFSYNPDIIVSGFSGNIDKKIFLLGISNYSIKPTLWGNLFKANIIKAAMPSLPREIVMGEDIISNLVLGLMADRIIAIKDLQYCVNYDNPSSVMNTFKNTFEYECLFFKELDKQFLNKCIDLPYYQDLLHNIIFLKLNGFKNIVLDGNRIDTDSEEWHQFITDIRKSHIVLGPSDRLFLLMQNWQKSYRVIMNLYLKFKR